MKTVLTAAAVNSPRTNQCAFQALATCVNRLTILFAIQREIMRNEAAWMPSVPYWDAKLKIGEHVLEDANGIESLLKRLHELKAGSAEHKQVAGLDQLMSEFSAAPTADDWLRGLYVAIKPWLVALLRQYLSESDPVMDAPTHQILANIIADQERQIAWFKDYSPGYSQWEQPNSIDWCVHLQKLLSSRRLDGGSLHLDTAEKGESGFAMQPEFAISETARRDSANCISWE